MLDTVIGFALEAAQWAGALWCMWVILNLVVDLIHRDMVESAKQRRRDKWARYHRLHCPEGWIIDLERGCYTSPDRHAQRPLPGRKA